jgi:hypothetical protein
MSDYRAGDLSERERRLPQRSADGHTTVAAPPQHPVLRMQRTVGNAAVARMLQRAGEEDEVQTKRDTSIQREAEGGEAEEEELQMKRDTSVQREAEGGEAEEEELQMKRDTSIQRKAVGLEGGALDEDMSKLIDSKRGGGSTLDDGVRAQAETAMGTSFEGVRVHRDTDADTINRNITAKAFTTGNDIFLRGDQNPGDASLMTHELTHVVQQRSMGGTGGQGKTVGAADDPYEREADRVAEAVTSGATQRELDDGAH